MDKGQRHTDMCLNKEQQTVRDGFQWDSADSDTESLVQQRAFQLRLNISNDSHDEPVNISQEANEDSGDEDLRVFDSLEMSSSQPVRNERKANSQVFQEGSYSHLQPQEGPLISVDESFIIIEEKIKRERQEGVRKDGYMLITSTSPPVMMISQNNSYDRPYLLHPQYGQNNTVPKPSLLHCPTSHASRETHELAKSGVCSELTEEQSQAHRETLQQRDKLAKAQRQLEDIVERNKITLGHNATKSGSYAKAHARRTPQNGAEVRKRSKGKKAERKESLIPSGPEQPPAPGVKAEHGDALSSPLTKTTVKSLNKAPSSSHPLAPTVQLNISHTILHMPPFPIHKQQESIVHLMSCHRRQCINSDHQNTQPPQQQTSPTNSSMVCPDGQWNLEKTLGQQQRVVAFKEHSSEEEDQGQSPSEDLTSDFAPFSETASNTCSPSSSSYRVLPPIGRPGPQKEAELSPTHPGQRRESDGYLMQMEKKKLLRTRPAYKTYSLKDYKQLQPAATLQGLGADYTAVEKTKMRRQKLYSNVIREHNKKTSRIPGPPAKDLEADSKKVPRMKALEYAKTIAKPLGPGQRKVKEKQKELNQPEDLSEPGFCLDGIEWTTLDLLRKRHEDEKQAVALFWKIHSV